MKYRKLRIAWSVGCGIVCLLLMVLWVRSYGIRSRLEGSIWPWMNISCVSSQGRLSVTESESRHSGNLRAWRIYDSPLDYRTKGRINKDFPYKYSAGFRVAWHRDLVVTIPHWFVILVTAMTGALPWITLPYRFSLRTLLIGMTVVAVVLGIVAAL